MQWTQNHRYLTVQESRAGTENMTQSLLIPHYKAQQAFSSGDQRCCSLLLPVWIRHWKSGPRSLLSLPRPVVFHVFLSPSVLGALCLRGQLLGNCHPSKLLTACRCVCGAASPWWSGWLQLLRLPWFRTLVQDNSTVLCCCSPCRRLRVQEPLRLADAAGGSSVGERRAAAEHPYEV